MATKSTPRLGKGLHAIIGNRPARSAERPAAGGEERQEVGTRPAEARAGVAEIPVESIRPNPKQPRQHFDEHTLEALAASIRSKGVIQPIVVRGVGPDAYELVAGERRWRGAKLAGLKTIPAIVRDLNDAAALEVALVENLQREDLGPIERAEAYNQYMEAFGSSPEALAERLGESRSSVANYLRLLRLPPEIRTMVESGELGMGQARAVLGVADPERQMAIARLAIRRNLSVRQVEGLCRDESAERNTAAEAEASSARPAHLREVESSLSKALGLLVRLQPGKKKNSGRVVIRYGSLEEFDRIAEAIGGRKSLE